MQRSPAQAQRLTAATTVLKLSEGSALGRKQTRNHRRQLMALSLAWQLEAQGHCISYETEFRLRSIYS